MPGPRILLLLPQMPQDPSSGATRTVQTAAEMAQDAGFEVRALATTATELGAHTDPLALLNSAGIQPEVHPATPRSFREIRFEQRGLYYTLLDTGRFPVGGWEKTHGRQFDLLLESELATFHPDIVFTFGGQEPDLRRHKRIRRYRTAIAFCVLNQGYLVPGFGRDFEAILTPSRWLANLYREKIGLETTPIPNPLDFADVISEERDPIFVTMVNPSIEKGLFFFVRLAEELGKYQPKIALLAIESRGTAGMVCKAALDAGFDLRRHESIMIAPAVPKPRDIYTHTRALIAPSVWDEAAGRVIPEALVNGVVPIVSDRGGLAESANGAGFTIPLPGDYTWETRTAVSAEAVKPWMDMLERLAFDEPFYQAEVAKARAAGEMYRRENLAPRYVEFFREALRNVK